MSEYRQGYSDAKDLISSLGTDVQSVRLAHLAVPPAMPKEYRDGFVKACEDAIQRWRPNKNYILSIMRDGDMDDPWGTAMAWAFACAETLTVLSENVPDELEYRPSPFVAVESIETYNPESYEDQAVWEYLDIQSEVFDLDTLDRIAEVQFAARCLSRYIDWCKAAGRDY